MKKLLTTLAVFVLLFGVFSQSVLAASEAARTGAADFQTIAQGIIDWKKADNGSSADGFLINNAFLEFAGTTPGDWFPIGLGRFGVADDQEAYLAVIREKVEERYRGKNKLSAAKATEWHRISLAVLACGGDPTAFGTDEYGNSINLIADGTYDRGKNVSLGKQGINGWIWGLIALDSMRYEIPEGSFYSRDDIIIEILRQQLTDGGFALSGKASDPDITAMALQALAPYYNEEKAYTYMQRITKTQRTVSVRQIVDEALVRLSALQMETGDYSSWGTQNVESTDQVIVALCSLGIDPLTDTRFIKNGNTLYDGILRYRMPDGGFVHSYNYDPDNPSSHPDKSNTMASEQTLYTLAALWRQANGMRTLYDFRPEMSESMKERISSLQNKIAGIDGDTKEAVLTGLLTEFYELPENERSYVNNYWILSDTANEKKIDVSAIAATTSAVEDTNKQGPDDTPLLYFSESDRAEADALPDRLTTESYVIVIKLLDKLDQSEDFDGKETYTAKLTDAKRKIAAIQGEIDALNAEIREKLYPFDGITLSDKQTVDGIVERYEALSEYDRTFIEHYEDVVKTRTKTDNLLRALIISGALLAVIGTLTVAVCVRIHRRKRKKQREMDELAAQYDNECEP